MKKILIFLGIFTFSILAFGVNDKDEKEVIVTAEFMAPISVNVIQHADFGTVIAQNYSSKNRPSTSSGHHGEIKISGDGDIKIQWADITQGEPQDVKNTRNLKVVLTNENNPAQQINSEFMLVENEGDFKNIENLKLTESSPATLFVTGTLTDISSNTPSGVYKGSIVFRVEYTDDASN